MAKTVTGFNSWQFQDLNTGTILGLSVGPNAFGAAGNGNEIVQNQYGRPGFQLKATNRPSPSPARGGFDHESSTNGWRSSSDNNSVIVWRHYFAVEAFPSGSNALIFSAVNNDAQGFPFRMLPNGRIETGYKSLIGAAQTLVGDVLTNSVQSDIRLCPQRWHRLDFMLDRRANPWVLQWMINGRPQASSSIALAPVTLTTIFLTGHYARPVNGFTIPAGTQVAFSTDAAVSFDPADYPLGPGRSFILKPNGVIFNPIVPPTGLAGGYRRSWDLAEVTTGDDSWRGIADQVPPLLHGVADTSGDGKMIEMYGPFQRARSLDITFSSYALEAGEEFAGMQMWIQHRSSTDNPPTAPEYELRASGVGSVRASSIPLSTSISAHAWGGVVSRLRPPTELYPLTQAKVDDVHVRWRTALTFTTALPTEFIRLAAIFIEVHVVHPTQEFTAIGCPQGRWGSIGA